MRFGALAVLLIVAPAAADVQAPERTARTLRGTFQGPSYVTTFDGEGRWSTVSGSTQAGGRYSLDDGLLMFTTEPSGCAKERVRYRFTTTADGFRLHFLEDSCGRSHQMEDLVFVRMKSIAN